MSVNARVSKPIWILAIAFGVCLVIYLTAAAVMSTQWFHTALERAVVRQIESATGARAAMRSLKIRPLILEITIHGLTLHGLEGAIEPPLLSAKTLVIRVNPESLLRWKLMISRFDADGIEAHVTTRANGTTNIPGPRQSTAADVSQLMDLSIGRLNLRQSDLYWNNQRIRLDLSARNTGVLLYRGLTGGYYGSISSGPVLFVRPGLRLPPIKFVTRIALSQDGVTLSQLVLRSAGLAGQASAKLNWKTGLSGQASFNAAGEISTLAKALSMAPVPSGSLALRGEASYNRGNLAVQGAVEAKGVLLHDPRFNPGPVNLASDFNAGLRQINLTHLGVRALGGAWNGDGTVKMMPSPQFTLHGRISHIDSRRALQLVSQGADIEKLLALGPSQVSGPMDAAWAGNFKNFHSNFSLAATPPSSSPASERPLTGAVEGSVVLSPGLMLRIKTAQFATPHSSFTAQGELGGPGGPGSGLSVRYATTDFRETQPLLDTVAGISKPLPLTLHSQALFAGSVTGSIANPEIEGQLRVGQFTLRGWSWTSLQAAVRASPQGFEVENAQVRSGPSTFDFGGSAGLSKWKVTPESQVSFSARAAHSPLEGLEEAFGFHTFITGLATGSLQVRGTASNLSGQGNFEASGGAIGGEPYDSFSGNVLITGSTWDFQDVSLRKEHGTLSGWARFNFPSKSFSLQFHGANFTLADFKRLRALRGANATGASTGQATPLGQLGQQGEAGTSPSLQGAVEASLKGSGTFGHPNIQSEVKIQNLRVEQYQAGGLTLQIVLAGDQVRASAALQGAEGNLKLNSVVDLHGDWPAQLSGSFSNLRLDPWLSAAGRGHIGAPVVATGSLKGDGPLKSPGKIALEADADKVAILIPGLNVQNVQPVEVRYANEHLESNRFEMRGQATQLSVHLSARLAPPAEFSLDLAGNAQASLLELFDPSLQAAGSFSVNLHDSGPVAQPALSGDIGVHDLSVRYGALPLPVSGLNGSITLSGNRATIRSLREETGQTSLDMSGYVTLGQIPTFNLAANFDHVRLEYPTDFTSILSGKMALTGSTASSRLSGDVTVSEMFVSENFNLVNWLGETGISLETPPRIGETGAAPTLASKTRLDVRVVTNPTVRLNSPTLSFVASIDANLGGTVARPVATGDIHLLNGQARIAGGLYTITRGDVSMTSPYRTTPVLDIEAQTRVERYDVTVDISGPADSPKMSYHSDPPLPSEQILSLLALGYAPQQALMSSSGAQHLGVAGAGSLLTSALNSQMSSRFQKLFGVSRISIDPNLLGPTSAGGARVTVEEQVARNLTVTYSTNTAAAQQRDIRLLWDVTDKISLLGERDINGVYGFEIRFRRRLK